MDNNFPKDIRLYLIKSVVKRAMFMKEFWQPGWPNLKYLCERESCCHVKNSISYYDGFMKCQYVNRYIWSSTSISPYNQLSANAHVF